MYSTFLENPNQGDEAVVNLALPFDQSDPKNYTCTPPSKIVSTHSTNERRAEEESRVCRAPFPTRNYSSAPLACHYPSPEADPAEADAYTCSSTFHEMRRACNCDFFPFELSTRPSRVPVSFELYPRDQWKSRFQASCRSRSTATKGTSRRLERNRRARNDRVSMENARQEDIPDNWEMTFRKTITNFRYTGIVSTLRA